MNETQPNELAPKDLGIVHITDLHFSTVKGAIPSWTNAFLDTLSSLARQDNLQLYAIAVTGDLVDSPNQDAFSRVREFLNESLVRAGIVKNGRPDLTKLWVVDGNHDWKAGGWGQRSPSGGIKEMGGIDRLSTPFLSEDGRFVSFGLNSGKGGIIGTARGAVDVKELQEISTKVKRFNNASLDQHKFACRMALVHHHLIPLPLDPAGETAIKKIINDEATKLLGNAGQVSAVLMKTGVNLVLHGHEHSEFVARLHHNMAGSYKNYFMTIAAAPQANKGFHLIRFKVSGDVELQKYILSNQVAYESTSAPTCLWTNDEWQASIWGRVSKEDGYYEKMTVHSYLSHLGDLEQSVSVKTIRAGEGGRIDHVAVTNKGEEGLSWLTSAHLSESSEEMGNDCASLMGKRPSRENYEERFILEPAATFETAHPGYQAKFIHRNLFAMTTQDVALRKSTHEEFIITGSHHHVREFRATIKFPRNLAPAKVEVKVYSKEENLDHAETVRANSSFDYNSKNGVGFFRLLWVRSGYKYRFAWGVPEPRFVNKREAQYYREIDRISTEWSNALFAQNLKDSSTPLNQLLLSVRDDLKKKYPDSDRSKEDLKVGMFALHPGDNLLKPVSGTYDEDSPIWKFSLNWGTGVVGWAMRRGLPNFYHSESKVARTIYVGVPGCKPDVYIMAIPVFAPLHAHSMKIPQQDKIPPNFYKAVVCVHTSSFSSGLGKLHHDNNYHEERQSLAGSLSKRLQDFFLGLEQNKLGKP